MLLKHISADSRHVLCNQQHMHDTSQAVTRPEKPHWALTQEWDILKAVCRACSTALATAVASGSPSAWPSFLSSAAAFSKEVARLLTTLSRTTCMQQIPSLRPIKLLSVQQIGLCRLACADWPRPLHGYCSTTAIVEGLARLLTILCHVHATQSKLAAAIKSRDLHITSVSTNSND